MTTIYHNPKCRKSRAGLKHVSDLDPALTVKEYIRAGISANEIREIVKMLNIPPFDLVRTQEEFYKENLKGKDFSDEEWFTILSENPKLIRRPIVERDGKAVLADPPEKADILFK